MEIALVHNDSLILGPVKYNYRMINSELEDLELEDRIGPRSYLDIPIHFSDGVTHILPLEKDISSYNPRYHNIGDYTWEISKDNDIPVRVNVIYSIGEKTLEEVKELRKKEIGPLRKLKENEIISLNINGTEIQTSISREERSILTSKLSALSASADQNHNYKFKNTWMSVNEEIIRDIISQINNKVQEIFDWEYSKVCEIDSCNTIDEVYNVLLE